MTTSQKNWIAAGLVAGGFVLLYWEVVVKLVLAWYTDDNYSHGFLIVPIAAYLAWERRAKFFAAPLRPSSLGLVVVVGSLLVLTAGILGSELFTTRISIVGTLVGGLLFLFGWARVRVLVFPLAFLLLMIPIPAIIFNQIAFPLHHARSGGSVQWDPFARVADCARARLRLFLRRTLVGPVAHYRLSDSNRRGDQRGPRRRYRDRGVSFWPAGGRRLLPRVRRLAGFRVCVRPSSLDAATDRTRRAAGFSESCGRGGGVEVARCLHVRFFCSSVSSARPG